jgi:hypothetical protein
VKGARKKRKLRGFNVSLSPLDFRDCLKMSESGCLGEFFLGES